MYYYYLKLYNLKRLKYETSKGFNSNFVFAGRTYGHRYLNLKMFGKRDK